MNGHLAAMHSYTQSLRFQLRRTSVQVIEIIPPWVQTELQGERGMNPRAMPLEAYIAETMRTSQTRPIRPRSSPSGKSRLRAAMMRIVPTRMFRCELR